MNNDARPLMLPRTRQPTSYGQFEGRNSNPQTRTRRGVHAVGYVLEVREGMARHASQHANARIVACYNQRIITDSGRRRSGQAERASYWCSRDNGVLCEGVQVGENVRSITMSQMQRSIRKHRMV